METVLAPAFKVGAPRRGTTMAPTPGPAFSVLVVAPQELVQYGIRLMLSREGWAGPCSSARDARGALAAIENEPVDVALIDVNLNGEATGEACLRLRKAAPRTARLLLTTNDFVPSRTVASMGADGFVSKGWTSRALTETLTKVCMGEPLRVERPGRDGFGLSPRQREMMQLLAEGATIDQIACLLHLSASTVKQHTSAAYRKLGVRNRAAAISRARELSLL